VKRILRAAAVTFILSLTLLLGLATPAEAAGGTATNFTVRDIKGKYVRLSDFSSKGVLMNFWATWCKPCLIELKHLQKLYKKYKSKGFVVLAVSMDGPETRAKVKPLVKRYKLKFPVVIDKETRIVKLYNPKNAAPFSVFIKKGKVTKTREGFQVSDISAIEKEVKDLIK
jgi:peroxiredoxin